MSTTQPPIPGRVRCKMKCVARNNHMYYGTTPQSVVKLQAVCDELNKSWASCTPSGSIELTIDNPAAYDSFVLGHHYFVDFTPAPAAEKDDHDHR